MSRYFTPAGPPPVSLPTSVPTPDDPIEARNVLRRELRGHARRYDRLCANKKYLETRCKALEVREWTYLSYCEEALRITDPDFNAVSRRSLRQKIDELQRAWDRDHGSHNWENKAEQNWRQVATLREEVDRLEAELERSERKRAESEMDRMEAAKRGIQLMHKLREHGIHVRL
jgi:hypothetical protein